MRTGAAARHEGEPSVLQLIEQPQLPPPHESSRFSHPAPDQVCTRLCTKALIWVRGRGRVRVRARARLRAHTSQGSGGVRTDH